MPLASGTKLGPYEIQSLLGAGGMGEVYLAQDPGLDRTLAIKVLASSFFSAGIQAAHGPRGQGRLVAEASEYLPSL